MARKLDPFKLRRQNQSVWDVKEERDAGRAHLIDLKNHKDVVMEWGFNEEMTRDQVFSLKIGDQEVYLNTEDMQRYLRWV